ncbi:hypothetical protein EMCRGX_G010563 [Ephydatia muelleri]
MSRVPTPWMSKDPRISGAPGNLGNNSPLDRNESRVPENLDNAEPWAHQESKEPQGERQPMVTKAAGTSGIPGYRGQPGQKGDPLVLHVLLMTGF